MLARILGSLVVYQYTLVPIARVQTGVRIEARLLKVLKGLAEYLDLSLGDLLEGVLLHAFEQKAPFDESTIKVIDQLKQVYGLELGASDSHNLQESHEAEKHD
jgi:hypothetical protein